MVLMFDASTVGLLCALAVVFGYCVGLYHTRYFIRPVPFEEVERRTRPGSLPPPNPSLMGTVWKGADAEHRLWKRDSAPPWVPGKRRDAPAPDPRIRGEVDVE